MQTKFLVVFAAFIALIAADCYMQYPPGSNDRNQEANTDRDNANRLFDSQNNAQGGYCRGPAMSFYSGSQMTILWTTQHGCGRNPGLMCNLVIQYMCSQTDANDYNLIRDGTTTNTITADSTGPTTLDTNSGDLLYGMHETYDYYTFCLARDRNQGLFIADRESEGGLTPTLRSAIYTRQNNDGERYGYECQEERDYYPYWGPSSWIDIAVLAQNSDWCSFYQAQSQNVLGRGYCTKLANDTSNDQNAGTIYGRYIWESDCTSASSNNQWLTIPAWGVAAPDCIQAPFTRENHLGNGFSGFEDNYNWTLPSFAPTNWTDPSNSDCVANSNCNCVLRIRYNISTSDGSTDSVADYEQYANPISGFIDFSKNAASSPITEDPTVTLDGATVQLAIDTTQFGRTFSDRSFMFHILARPSDVPAASRIYLLSVKGKRGNIVQTYPATEYGYVPEFLTVTAGDYINFQWTGCDQNPAGNAGEGADQTDRSNIMQLKAKADSYPVTNDWLTANPSEALFPDASLRLFMTYQGQTGCDPTTLNNDNNADTNCYKLNASPQLFNAGLVQMNVTGQYYFTSSRNNDFSNRGQKGSLLINSIIPTWALGVVVTGGAIFLGAGAIGGLMLYAKAYPHSSANSLVSRL
jgi:hypothetical protein